MPPYLLRVIAQQGGVATAAQFHEHTSRRTLQRLVRTGCVVRVWPNIYSSGTPDAATRLRGLDLRCGETVAVCLGTAAGAYGFDTENTAALHVLNPSGHLLRDTTGLVVHRRTGMPLTSLRGRPLTPPAWTAIEIARGLPRPRALATLDAALRSQTCDRDDLSIAAAQQAGRRNVVRVRDLIPLARPEAESPMESEARLAMIEGGLPEPVLQFEIIDREGRRWRVDFGWPDARLAVEYDGFEWHSSPDHLRRDRQKRAALQEIHWRVLSIVSDDVRRHPSRMVRWIEGQLITAAA